MQTGAAARVRRFLSRGVAARGRRGAPFTQNRRARSVFADCVQRRRQIEITACDPDLTRPGPAAVGQSEAAPDRHADKRASRKDEHTIAARQGHKQPAPPAAAVPWPCNVTASGKSAVQVSRDTPRT